MMPYIIGGLILTLITVYFIFTKRTFAMLDENINNAMNQIGIQLSNRWDALSILLDLTKDYANDEYQLIFETLNLRRQITAENSVTDVAIQDNSIIKTIGYIITIADEYPTLKADQDYQKIMDSINQYDGMFYQSRLTYNYSVAKINRHICMFPDSIVAGILNYSKHDYLELDSKRIR